MEWIFHNESKDSQPVHYLYKVQDDHPETVQGGHPVGSLGNLAGHKVSILPHPKTRRHHCFLQGRWKNTTYSFRTLPFGLSTATKTFTRIKRPISLHYKNMGITLFLYLDDDLILVESCMQAKIDGMMIVSHLQKLGFILDLNRMQVWTCTGVHSSRSYSITREMKISLPMDKVQAMKAQALRVALLLM